MMYQVPPEHVAGCESGGEEAETVVITDAELYICALSDYTTQLRAQSRLQYV